METSLKLRLIRIAAIGRELCEGDEPERELIESLEELGLELCALSGVCDVCFGAGYHPGVDPDDFDGETPLEKCPSCAGKGVTL